MTKARDIASGAPAPAGVTTTELGFVDGVTSAIQTQLGTKIAQATAINPAIVDAKGDLITATANDTPARLGVGANDTILTADSSTATGLKWAAAPVAGMTNPMTTTGDTIYSSSGSTPARLAIGSSGQVLTVSGGAPAWSTLAAGGGKTLLSTTALSGASTTISGISGSYKDLQIVVVGASTAGSSQSNLRINGATTNYNYGWIRVLGGVVAGNQATNGDAFSFIGASTNTGNANNRMVSVINIPRYTDTTQICTWNTWGGETGGSPGQSFMTGGGYYNGGSALTSITFICQFSTFSSGTVYIYGVN